jgi:TonB family protein
MDRLKIKCLAASAGFHALLAVVLLSSSAFRLRPHPSQSPNAGAGIIELVTVPLEHEAVTPGAGASPSALPQTAAPPAAPPRKTSEALQRSTQPKAPSSVANAQRQRSQNPSTSPGTASNDRLLELSRALEGMARRMPSGKAIELDLGSGSGGKDDAYARIVRFFYSQSWEPSGNADPRSAVKAKITIASDGKVSSARILEPSGDVQIDESVRLTLERVQFIEPFESGAKESERTYTINFSVRTTVAAADTTP